MQVDKPIPELESNCGSWIVTRRADNKVIGEFYARKVVERFDPAKCLIETALQYLVRISREIENDTKQKQT